MSPKHNPPLRRIKDIILASHVIGPSKADIYMFLSGIS